MQNTPTNNERTSIGDTKLVLIGREFDKVSGEFIAYVIKKEILLSDVPIKQLELRQRFNTDLKYFVMFKKDYDDEDKINYVLGLIKKGIASDLYTYV